jgi:hypothetical protein
VKRKERCFGFVKRKDEASCTLLPLALPPDILRSEDATRLASLVL